MMTFNFMAKFQATFGSSKTPPRNIPDLPNASAPNKKAVPAPIQEIEVPNLLSKVAPITDSVKSEAPKKSPFPTYHLLSDKAKEILDSRPRSWEHLLFGQVLIDNAKEFTQQPMNDPTESERSSPKFQYHICSLQDIIDLPQWQIKKGKFYVVLCKSFALLGPDNHDEIFGPQGQSGSPEKIVNLCAGIATALSNTLQYLHSMQFCRVTYTEPIEQSFKVEIDLFTASVLAYFISEKNALSNFFFTLGEKVLEAVTKGSTNLTLNYVCGVPEFNIQPLLDKLQKGVDSNKTIHSSNSSIPITPKFVKHAKSDLERIKLSYHSKNSSPEYINTPAKGTEIAFVDLETTGLDPYSDRIIEIGLVIVTIGESQHKEWSDTVNIGYPISYFISEYTGISNAQLEKSKTASEVLPSYYEKIGNRVVAAYNAEFDMGFLRQEAQRLGIQFINQSFCVMEQAKSALRFLDGGYKLGNVAAALRVNNDKPPHRALADAELAVQICEAIWSGKKAFGAESIKLYVANTLINPETGIKITTPTLDFTSDAPRLMREWPGDELGRIWTDDHRDYINIYWPEGEYGVGVLARVTKSTNPEFAGLFASGAPIDIWVTNSGEDTFIVHLNSSAEVRSLSSSFAVYGHYSYDDILFYIYVAKKGEPAFPDDEPVWDFYLKHHLNSQYKIKCLRDGINETFAKDFKSKFISGHKGDLLHRKSLCSADEQFRLYSDLTSESKKLRTSAKEKELHSPVEALEEYQRSLDLIGTYSMINYEGGLYGKVLQESMLTSHSRDAMKILDRMTLIMCRINRPLEAQHTSEFCFEKFPHAVGTKLAETIKKRVKKANLTGR